MTADRSGRHKSPKRSREPSAAKVPAALPTPSKPALIAGFVVNESLTIVEFLGNTGPFLNIVPGSATLGLRKMLKAALQSAVCGAVARAAREDHVQVPGVPFLEGREPRSVDIEVLRCAAGGQTRYRILLHERNPPAPKTAESVRPAATRGKQSEVVRLENELGAERASFQAALTERDLKHQAASEELEAANQQLQAAAADAEEANAELEAATEELNRALRASQQSEQRMRESEQRFRLLADHLPVLVWTSGPQGCEFVNREYLQFLGCSLQDVVGTGWARYIHPDEAADYVGVYQNAWERQQRFEKELRFRRADGVYRHFRTTGVPRFTSQETFVGFIGCTVDITDIKESEAALREADRRKDDFLAVLGHELRNPLAAIRTGTLLLQADPSRERRDWVHQMISRQVLQLERLMGDLLDVTHIERGKFQLQKERTEIRECVEPAVEATKELLQSRGHELSVSLPSEDVHLDADCSRVEQIVVNLLINAAKYTPEGGKIWLAVEQAGEEIVLRCRDTGVGLAPESLNLIFEPFVQVNSPNSAAGASGLGIGLALVKSLAEMHGGSVVASSPGLGQGSEFTLRLPVHEGSATSLPQRVRNPPASAAPPRQVLLIDDNRDLAQSMAILLESQGHRVAMAHDGATGLSLAEQHCPDIVLLDLGLPDMDGQTVAARMRAIPVLQRTMIVAVSGFHLDEDERMTAPHFDAHLVKPLHSDQLLELMQNVKPDRNARRILLIEDNQELALLTAELFRQQGLEVEIALNGGEGIEKARRFRPRVVFCDLNLPDMRGRDVAQVLRAEDSTRPLLLVGVSAASLEEFRDGGNMGFDLLWPKPLRWPQVDELLASLDNSQKSISASQ
jgi:PAS domain S-box-containing protein